MLNKVRKMIERQKIKQWQNELTEITLKTGITLQDVCDYLDLNYNRDVGFFVKIPKKRRMMIGIGMAFGQPLDVINRWITTYAGKRKLYSKDISEDLIWIYLINTNSGRSDKEINYFKLYESYQEAAFETYMTIWNEVTAGSSDTEDVDRQLSQIGDAVGVDELKEFVINNIDSFKTAYSKPRRMLAKYVKCLLNTKGKDDKDGKTSLISLRGWLDDSMINYLSGSTDTVNVTDLKTGSRIPDLKHIPKNRKSHISLALALGMTVCEINQYLEMMGYIPLDEEDIDDAVLIKELNKWDEEHPLQKIYKKKYIEEDDNIDMTLEEEQRAANDMLMLRQDLKDQYKRRKLKFVYVKA